MANLEERPWSHECSMALSNSTLIKTVHVLISHKNKDPDQSDDKSLDPLRDQLTEVTQP